MRTWGCDVNVRWESDDRITFGPAPLHTAVRHGAIECVYCLLSYHADLNLVRRVDFKCNFGTFSFYPTRKNVDCQEKSLKNLHVLVGQ